MRSLQPPPHIESTPTVSEMGVKTKTQLLAERAVLRQLITSVIAASADKDLNPKGRVLVGCTSWHSKCAEHSWVVRIQTLSCQR